MSILNPVMFAGREQRDALIDGEVKRSLQTMEADLQRPGWAAEKLDQEASALWLSQRVDQSKAEIDRNFAGISRAYFGRELTPSAVYDEIVRHEAETAQMAIQPVLQPKQAKQAAPAEAGQTDKKEVKSWQFLRTAGASFEETGQNTAAGVFSMIEGALNTLGGTPEKKGISGSDIDTMRQLYRLENNRLGNTDEAQRLRGIVESRARELDQEFLARKAEWENSTIRGALSSTAREHADFFFELGKESYDRYGSDAAYRDTYVGMAAQMSGQMVASSAIMASASIANVGRAGYLGAKAAVAGAAIAGTAQGVANATQNRREFMGEDYRNEGWQFIGDVAIGAVQQKIESVKFLDNALELAVKTSSRGGSVTMGQVLRQFPKQAAKSGAVEGAEEVLQGAWEDFIVDMAYDDERVVDYGANMDYIKRRAGEAFAGFAGGVMMKGMVAPLEMAQQNIDAKKAKKMLTAKDGGTFGPNDVKLLAQARSDEEILAMPEGELLLKATKGDEAARTEYNSKIITQNFKPTDGLVLPNGDKLGEYKGRPMLLKEDGQLVDFDMSDSEEAANWNSIQQQAVNYAEMVKLNEDLKGEDALQATSDMVEYVKQLQAERGGITTIETKAKIGGLEAQFGREEAEKKVAAYVKAGALPAGTTLDTLAPTRGASDTKWDDKTRQFVTAIRIAEGGDVLVVMEESAHDYFKRQIELGQFNNATVDGWRKQVEAGWSGKMEYTEMHEWLAKYAVGYAMGKVQETEASNLPLSFKRFLDRFAKLFRESLDFAAKVMQMEREGALPAQFLRALQEATGTADDRGVNEVPLMSELDQEMATQAMKVDTFPKIEGNEEAGWTVSDPDGLLIATTTTLEDAQDKAMAWYMKQELASEKKQAKNQGVKASEELQRVIIMKGGLLAPSGGDMSGELRAVAENLDAGKRLRLFRKNALSLDEMREALVGEGFQFQTVNDLLVALDESTRGNPVYARGGEETFSLSDSRAKPADASNVTVLPDGAQLVGPTTFALTAYHGTPHKVDKFSMDKIGTGEGAQAYGWGLYFAENKAVAGAYADSVKDVARINKVNAELKSLAEVMSRDAIPGEYRKFRTDEGRKAAELYDAQMAERQRVASSTGNLYTVELLPDADSFLDWDKPLSEQSDKVKAALGKAGRFTQQERTTLPIRNVLEILGTAKEASEKLLAAGISGIRYLDGASRGKGGTSNYVIFDESLVKIIEENGKKVEQAGATTRSLAVDPSNRPKTSEEIALAEEIDRIFAMQKLKSWQRFGLAAVADMQRETMVARVNAANNVARLENNGEFGDAMGRFFLTVRSELDRFAPGLGTLLEISSYEKAKKTARDKKVIVALAEKITALPNANLILEQFRVLARRDDRTNLETLARANGFAKELAAAEAMLTDIRRDIIEAGEEYSRFWSQPANFEASDAFKADMDAAKRVRKGRVGEAVERVLANYGFTKNIEFYWPSKVFDVKGLQEFMRGAVVGSKMEQAYRALEAEAIRKGKAIDEEDLDGMVSKLVANRGKAGPSALKGRTIANEDINFAMMQFYVDPIETALNHVESMRTKIQQRQFFGKSIKLDIEKDRGTGASPIDLVQSTSTLVGALAGQGKLDEQTRNNLKKLIDARFNPTPSMRAVNVMKALGYVFGLGQAYSGLTASVDGLGIGLRENSVNPVGVFTGLIQAVTGKNKITLEEAGIDIRDIGAEFQSGEKWEDSMVRWVFKWNGLTYLSKTFVQAGLNAALNNAIKTAKKGNMSGLQQKRLQRLFGQDAAQVEAMLAAGQKTPETMLFAWATVATYQPISQDQQSQAMLTSQYGKLFFQFRSFLTVQFSGMRDDCYNEIKSGDKTRMMNGTKQLLALTATLLMLGLPMEALKAWLTGRTFILDEQITNRLLGLIGLNAYVTREARRDPIRGATSLMIPAVGSTVTDLWRDADDLIAYAKASDQTDMTLAELLLNARVLSNVPFIGRIYDERLGSNAERNAQQREDIGWFVTTKPKEEGADEESLTRKIRALEKRVQGN
jgi:hypothetical protein